MYASTFTYTDAGAVTSMQLGNGLWESTQFNARLQPVQIGLGTSVASQNLLKLNYDYGTTANNGNVLSQTITVPAVGQTPGFTAVQNYSYDSLNWLKSAVENVTPHGGSAVQSWKQTYSFDRYGNRRFDEPNTTTIPKLCNNNTVVCPADRKIHNPSINAANNRMNTSDGYSFDSVGNMTADAQGRVFRYDAENKQYEVRNSANQVIGQYFFDGNGKRVKKVVPASGEITVFVYDAASNLVAEYSTQLSQTQQVSYITPDHLGSPRVKTDQNGAVIARNDYHPYGEDLITSQRTTALCYKPDDVRQKFAGHLKDEESWLDFVEARIYANHLGRFTSVDSVGPDLKNPQTLNKYQYSLNNPMRYVDKNGKYEEDVHRELTAVLAYAAGFTREQGQIIGRANQWVDDNPETNPEVITNVRARRDYHFTIGDQRDRLWGDFEHYVRNGSNGDAYSALGTYLHAYQDSYSHEGFNPVTGQVASGFRQGLLTSWNVFWSEVRKVDKTSFDLEKAERMAEGTFRTLFLAMYQMKAKEAKFGTFAAPISYDIIRSSVAAWLRATNVRDKAKYLDEIYRKIEVERKRLEEEAKAKARQQLRH